MKKPFKDISKYYIQFLNKGNMNHTLKAMIKKFETICHDKDNKKFSILVKALKKNNTELVEKILGSKLKNFHNYYNEAIFNKMNEISEQLFNYAVSYYHKSKMRIDYKNFLKILENTLPGDNDKLILKIFNLICDADSPSKQRSILLLALTHRNYSLTKKVLDFMEKSQTKMNLPFDDPSTEDKYVKLIRNTEDVRFMKIFYPYLSEDNKSLIMKDIISNNLKGKKYKFDKDNISSNFKNIISKDFLLNRTQRIRAVRDFLKKHDIVLSKEGHQFLFERFKFLMGNRFRKKLQGKAQYNKNLHGSVVKTKYCDKKEKYYPDLVKLVNVIKNKSDDRTWYIECRNSNCTGSTHEDDTIYVEHRNYHCIVCNQPYIFDPKKNKYLPVKDSNSNYYAKDVNKTVNSLKQGAQSPHKYKHKEGGHLIKRECPHCMDHYDEIIVVAKNLNEYNELKKQNYQVQCPKCEKPFDWDFGNKARHLNRDGSKKYGLFSSRDQKEDNGYDEDNEDDEDDEDDEDEGKEGQ